MINKPVIYYDGYCNLCQSAIQFILKRDKKSVFEYRPLQFNNEIPDNLQNLVKPETVFLIDNKIYTKSSAIICILIIISAIKLHWYILFLIPKFVRDFIYTLISKNRYKWFGQRTSCYFPKNTEL